jgi:hypothetical protein
MWDNEKLMRKETLDLKTDRWTNDEGEYYITVLCFINVKTID